MNMEELFGRLTASYKAKMRAAIQEQMPEMDENELDYTIEALGIGFEAGLQTLHGIGIGIAKKIVDSPEKTI